MAADSEELDDSNFINSSKSYIQIILLMSINIISNKAFSETKENYWSIKYNSNI